MILNQNKSKLNNPKNRLLLIKHSKNPPTHFKNKHFNSINHKRILSYKVNKTKDSSKVNSLKDSLIKLYKIPVGIFLIRISNRLNRTNFRIILVRIAKIHLYLVNLKSNLKPKPNPNPKLMEYLLDKNHPLEHNKRI